MRNPSIWSHISLTSERALWPAVLYIIYLRSRTRYMTFKSNLVSDIFLSDKLGLRVFSLLKVFQIVFICVYESAAEILQNSERIPCRLVLDVSSICCWRKGERMTLKLSLRQTHWQISATKPNFKEAVFGLILNLISRITFYPLWFQIKVPRVQTCTILLDVMNALPLSMIGSEQCDVFFGNTNLSTHDPSRSRTCATVVQDSQRHLGVVML